MPQVNEFSWMFYSFMMLAFFFLCLVSFTFEHSQFFIKCKNFTKTYFILF